jgi:hypothetical protein
MKLENTQPPHGIVTEWPLELTPQQREQLLQEKINRVKEWLAHRTKKHDQQNCVCG